MRRIVYLIACIVIVGVIGGALGAFSLFEEFPQPMGSYAVGIKRLTLPHDGHSLMADMFYPSDRTDKTKTFAYQPKKLKALIPVKAWTTGIPAFVWRHLLSGTESFVQQEAPVAQGPFPLIIFLPGIGGDPLYNIYLEDLASHGYVVLALEPPGDTSVSVTEDGIVELNKEFVESIEEGDREAIYAYRRKAHERWKEYIAAALAYLTDKAYAFIDLDRIGLLGHSHGGGVVTDYCATDDRCRAGVNMDGWTKGAHTTQGFDKPFLLLANEQGLDELEELAQNMPSAIYKKIPGAAHGSFSDTVLLRQPFRWYFATVTGDPTEVRKTIQKELVTFFDRTLKQ